MLSLLQTLKKDTLSELGAYCKSSTYPTLMQKLIVQGLIKIEENIIEIHTRAEDKSIAERVLPDAIAEFKLKMAEAGRPTTLKVTISDSFLPAKMWYVYYTILLY